jgi:sugar phosphate isomerase/epimerase
VGRPGQFFIAPGPEDAALPIAASAWHTGRTVRLPMEHWEAILDFAEKLDAQKTQTLRAYAYPEGGRLLPPREELDAMLGFVRELEDAIRAAPPLVPELTEIFLEDYPNDEHIRMLQAVAAVLAEARRLELPFEGDVDT